MCRSRSVGVGTVVVDVEPARVESDTHAGVDASLQPLRTADFVLQLVREPVKNVLAEFVR